MSAYIDLSDTLVNKIVREHIEGLQSTEELHKFIMTVLRLASRWDDLWWADIKSFVDKQAKKME